MLEERYYTDQHVNWDSPTDSTVTMMLDQAIESRVIVEGSRVFAQFTMMQEMEDKMGRGSQQVKIKIRPTDLILVEIDGTVLRARPIKLPVSTTEKLLWLMGWSPKDKFHPKKYRVLKTYAQDIAQSKQLHLIEEDINGWAKTLCLSDGERFGYLVLEENPSFEEIRNYINAHSWNEEETKYTIPFLLKKFERIQIASIGRSNARKNRRKSRKSTI